MWYFGSRAASSSWSTGACWSKGRRTRSPPTRACARSISDRSAMAETLLALEHVRAGYDDAVVLDDISLEIPAQGGLAVLGRNGVGETTLLRAIMGCTDVARGRFL